MGPLKAFLIEENDGRGESCDAAVHGAGSEFRGAKGAEGRVP